MVKHLDAVEEEVGRFLASRDFEGLGFEQVRKALAAVDRLLEQGGEWGAGESFYDLSRAKAMLEEARPLGRRVEEVLGLASEVGLPFRADSTVTAFSVRLLDCELQEKVGQLMGGRPGEGRGPSAEAQRGPGRGIFDEELEDDGPRVSKRLLSGLGRPLGGSLGGPLSASQRDLSRASASGKAESDPYDMKRPCFPEVLGRPGCDSLRRAPPGPPLGLPPAIEPRASESLYHKREERTPGRTAKSHYFRTLAPGVVPAPPPGEREPSEQRRLPASASTRGVGSSSTAQTTPERQGAFGEARRFPRCYSSVITLGEDSGVIKNLVIDEAKFRLVLGSLRCVPKNVRVVEVVGNVFKCNPVPLLRNAFEGRLGFVLRLDMAKNQVMANLAATKRDVEALALSNILFSA